MPDNPPCYVLGDKMKCDPTCNGYATSIDVERNPSPSLDEETIAKLSQVATDYLPDLTAYLGFEGTGELFEALANPRVCPERAKLTKE